MLQTRFGISFISYSVIADKQLGRRDKKFLVFMHHSCFFTQRDCKKGKIIKIIYFSNSF